MSPFWWLLLGVVHGLQPDHVAAAAATGLRAGRSLVHASLRLAAGHALALGLMALLVRLWRPGQLAWLETWAAWAGSASLVWLGGALLLQVFRSHYVVHAHSHRHGPRAHEHLHAHPVEAQGAHEHRHGFGALMLGLVMGLGGARSLVLVVSAAASERAPLLLGLHATGVAAGCFGAAWLVSRVRHAWGARARWLDLVSAGAAVVAGVRLAFVR
ncbi:MAG: hypothetical protein RL199_716 [Pseudomonadota bacterium]|jgi:putative Mn2+ efflux pump MntP